MVGMVQASLRLDALLTPRSAIREEKATADRLAAFSDAVFAVIVTIMVLELKAPDQPVFSAIWPLWPTAVSYVVSYLFIAIIWINHHYLMRFVGPPTLRLMWVNFAHLFLVSLLPFATAWVARTRLGSSPVVFYAGLFVCVDIAYNVFVGVVLGRMRSSRRCADDTGRQRLAAVEDFRVNPLRRHAQGCERLFHIRHEASRPAEVDVRFS